MKKNGYEIDDDEWFREVSTGPRKPSKGKTNSFSLPIYKNGKKQRKRVHFQVYGLDSGNYELTGYIA